jgi:hypothetical protein
MITAYKRAWVKDMTKMIKEVLESLDPNKLPLTGYDVEVNIDVLKLVETLRGIEPLLPALESKHLIRRHAKNIVAALNVCFDEDVDVETRLLHASLVYALLKLIPVSGSEDTDEST